MYRLNLTYSSIILFIFVGVISCTSKGDKYKTAIDSTRTEIQSIQEKYMVPGICACVSIDGEIIWCEGFGFADLESKTKVDPFKTLFRIGSVSKPFTAEALAILFERGKIDWEDPVQKFVTYFPKKAYPISIKQVAGHIAGIRHYKNNEMLNDVYFPSVKEGLTIFMNDSLLFEPETRYKYSSYGWNLLSAVVEGASETDFLTYMDQNVFKPLDMQAIPDRASEDIPQRTTFYDRKDNQPVLAPKVDNSYKWAGGGFIATCDDLIKFGNAHLYPKLIKKETFKILTESQYINDSTATEYGIGWQNKVNDFGVKWVGHSGGSVGGITMLAIYPESKTVISLVSNSSNVGFKEIFHKIERWFNREKLL